jgi:hypothetical protein
MKNICHNTTRVIRLKNAATTLQSALLHSLGPKVSLDQTDPMPKPEAYHISSFAPSLAQSPNQWQELRRRSVLRAAMSDSRCSIVGGGVGRKRRRGGGCLGAWKKAGRGGKSVYVSLQGRKLSGKEGYLQSMKDRASVRVRVRVRALLT